MSFGDLPFVLSMGPQRAGTSWLDRYLRLRGDVCMPEGVKEIFFFDRHFDRGKDFYKKHFVPEPQHKLMMEISTTSFDYDQAAQRVHDVFGTDLKMICPLRDPIARSYSLYNHFKRYGLVHGTLQEAVEDVPQILYSSRYAEHLERWLDVFGSERIAIFYQEDMEEDQSAYVARVCEFLGLEFMVPEGEAVKRFNVSTASRYPRIALAAQHGADWLRRNNLYGIVNFAKAIGMKEVIFGKERPEIHQSSIESHDLAWLAERLGPEIEKFETLIGSKIPQWHA